MLFGKYQMGKLLGKGTFAKVYQGKSIITGESVAIKVIDKEQIKRKPDMALQIKREVSIMRLVRHPNVVELKEVMATRKMVFLVMECVRGGELFAKVVAGKLSEDQARRYFHQLISAVDFCHARGVSHRDIKPENLLLDENGNLKVSDFGLSSLPEQLRQDGLLHTQCGTPAYVAPEVLRKKGYDGATADLWSCGVVLFVLLAGFLPFQDENIMKMYRKVLNAEYKVPRWFSHGALTLVSKLLVADPGKRITVPEILEDKWFRKGEFPSAGGEIVNGGETPAPEFFNAFDLISAMATGFDLSGLFEEQLSRRRVFTSKSTAAEILDRVDKMGKKLGFSVSRGKGCQLKLEEKRKGKLTVTAEVFAAAPLVSVVELCKTAGDATEYVKFCEVDVRRGLEDIVWAWQADR